MAVALGETAEGHGRSATPMEDDLKVQVKELLEKLDKRAKQEDRTKLLLAFPPLIGTVLVAAVAFYQSQIVQSSQNDANTEIERIKLQGLLGSQTRQIAADSAKQLKEFEQRSLDRERQRADKTSEVDVKLIEMCLDTVKSADPQKQKQLLQWAVDVINDHLPQKGRKPVRLTLAAASQAPALFKALREEARSSLGPEKGVSTRLTVRLLADAPLEEAVLRLEGGNLPLARISGHEWIWSGTVVVTGALNYQATVRADAGTSWRLEIVQAGEKLPLVEHPSVVRAGTTTDSIAGSEWIAP